MMQFIRRSSPRFRTHNNGSLLIALMIGVTGALCAPPAGATLNSAVPRLLPTEIPPTYVVWSVDDSAGPTEVEQSQAFLRNAANDKAILVVSEPYERTSWDRDVRQFLDGKVKSVRINGRPAFVTDETNGIRSLLWFDRDRTFISYATGVDLAVQRRLAESVIRTEISRTSFTVRSLPRGFKMVFSGPTRALSSGHSTVTFVSDPRNARNSFTMEVRRVDRSYTELVYFSPLAGSSEPILVHGKSGYRTVSAGGTRTIWYEDQPGLLVAFSSNVMSDAEVITIANSVMPTTELLWKALEQQAIDLTTNLEVSPKLVGAGVVDGQPWTAQVAARKECLVFTVALTPVQTCVTDPNMLGWSKSLAGEKPLVVGVAAANVVTVVILVNGVEANRMGVSPVFGQPTLRLFVAPSPVGTSNVTVAGLDSNGAEIQPAVST
jgi:hypothetical protein